MSTIFQSITIINLYPNEYGQRSHYYPVTVNVGRCMRNRNDFTDLSNILCVPDKTEDLNLNVLNMITGKDESKALTKIYLSDMNATLIVGNTTLTKSGMMKHVNVSVKTIKYSKKITFAILVHVFVRMVSI